MNDLSLIQVVAQVLVCFCMKIVCGTCNPDNETMYLIIVQCC